MNEREKTEKEIEREILGRLETHLQRDLALKLETDPEWVKSNEPGIKHVIGILRSSRKKLNVEHNETKSQD